MDALITRRGGAGTDLNFRVVGGAAQPENPKENTIWVNTEQEITGWIFSATEPAEPVEGIVWLKEGLERYKEFNAVRKECLQVYVTAAYQYQAGAWVDYKDSQIYAGGAWIRIKSAVLLYNEGDECSALTGGWTGYNVGSGDTSGSYTKQETSLYMKATYNAGDYTRSVGFCTNSPVAIGEFTTMHALFNVSKDGTRVRLSIATSASNARVNASSPVAYHDIAGTLGEVEAVISLADVAQGSYYVGIGVTAGAKANKKTPVATVSAIWME